ncbi:PIR protein [Plasmodium yoelii]|uniref:PIR protein n=2 Tax=Plasmodium yoelii TaxID=5861 RepID=A0AAE9WWB0_PLAYO|nr:PIR protein [Plasmodium yoelii]WBY57653.1 PIR protein [Plasmodium yoelii yoelii]VTZ78671.1 PIR protein [Plasmodium yoelii]|eukprot:XP_022811056.1 PIR protein [Plasmodium yoelii]
MDIVLCTRFSTLRAFYPDELGKSTTHDFHQNGNIKNYCPNQKCNTDLDKINAGCLWLLDQLFVKNKKSDINIADYIIIWLSYMLNLKNDNNINNVNTFYDEYINKGEEYKKSTVDFTGCKSYIELINKKKNLMTINIENISKFYAAFKPLCNMYTELNANDTTDKSYLENANKFVEKYNELNEVSDITEDSPYYQVLSTLSNDYNNFKEFCNSSNVDCNDIQSLSPIKIKENSVQDSGQKFEATSSSSITNKLIPVLSIIGIIGFLLGISYKYSLFGFRKRFQKQQIREKLKK